MNRTFVIPINPVPASRPRVSKWGTYYGKTYKKFRKDIKAWMEAQDFPPVAEGPIKVSAYFSVKRPKTTKLFFPSPDIDNYLKAVFDGANTYLWDDDKQIVCTYATKRWAEPGEPGSIRLTLTQEEIE